MTQQEVKNIVNDIQKLADTKMFALLFVRLRLLLKELQQWWAVQRCEELETLCRQMLRYSLGDYEDPTRSKIIEQLQSDIYDLVDDIVEAIGVKYFSGYDYSQKRVSNLEQFSSSELSSILVADNKPFSSEKSNAIVVKFRQIWLSNRFSIAEYREILQFICDNTIELSARQMAVSALLLKGLRVYDSLLISLHIELLGIVEPQIRARVVVGLLFLVACWDKRIQRNSELLNSILELFHKESFVSEVDKAYKYLINTFGTDKVTQKITTEIYPEIFRSGAKFHQMLKDEGADLMNEEEFNPKWEKALMDDENVSAKLREFGDMQMQGADVYMSTFSSMKSYTFFSEIANWFMPFDVNQNDVARQMADMPDVLRFFAESTHICSSDKYSFFYSIAQIPASNFKSMMSGIGADAEAVREDLDSESWKNNPDNVYAVEVRNYVLDIYRFYRLYSRHTDFVNPFDFIDKFNNNAILSRALSIDLKKSICKYLFEVEHFTEALPLFEYLDAQQVWDAYFYQQMGYCYQQLERWDEAVSCYEKADLLEANDIWTLKRKALCYRKKECYADAISCYETILKQKDDDISAMLNLANLYLSNADYTKALFLFYKVEYLRPNSYKAISGLAKCLFMQQEYDKAITYYDRLSQHKDFSAEDALNYGHTFWALGAKDIARDYYRRAKSILDSDVKFAEKMIEQSANLQHLGLSEEEIVILINQILM